MKKYTIRTENIKIEVIAESKAQVHEKLKKLIDSTSILDIKEVPKEPMSLVEEISKNFETSSYPKRRNSLLEVA